MKFRFSLPIVLFVCATAMNCSDESSESNPRAAQGDSSSFALLASPSPQPADYCAKYPQAAQNCQKNVGACPSSDAADKQICCYTIGEQIPLQQDILGGKKDISALQDAICRADSPKVGLVGACPANAGKSREDLINEAIKASGDYLKNNCRGAYPYAGAANQAMCIINDQIKNANDKCKEELKPSPSPSPSPSSTPTPSPSSSPTPSPSSTPMPSPSSAPTPSPSSTPMPSPSSAPTASPMP